MSRRNWLLLTFLLRMLVACRSEPTDGTTRQDLTLPADMTTSGLDRGICFNAPGLACLVDEGCGTLATCQFGTCCSGKVDPTTCKCLCAGVPCPVPGACCPGSPYFCPTPANLGSLECRAVWECFPSNYPEDCAEDMGVQDMRIGDMK